ncbi:MAG: VacJ family lipoprotein [Rubrivivax sp.]|nr:VacJ family lipoprotein [Rubrivivax sp.]
MGWRRAVGTVVLAAALGGCASVAPSGPPVPQDPWESWNRRVFAFNEGLDEAVLRPVAVAYRDHVPELVRYWVGNVFGNFRDAWSTVNHLLQAKPADALHMGTRVLLNTTFGLGGALDIATDAGLERRAEDFGQTLGRWGVPPGPFVELPLLGPSTLRDTAALTLDLQAAPVIVLGVARDQALVTVLGIVHVRSTLLDATELLDSISLDRYQFRRDAYLTRRLSLVHDGNPPAAVGDDAFDYDVYEDDEPPPPK